MAADDPGQDATLAAPRTSAATSHELRLGVLMGPDAGKNLALPAGRSATVGVLAENDLVLTDPMVSRVHLELSPCAEGASLRDLGSLNGTYVGTLRVERAIVPVGTRVRVGGTVLVVDVVGGGAAGDPGEAPSIPGLVFQSRAMADVARAVGRLALGSGPVLIEGETGTGKEAMATAIHRLGARGAGPLVVVDCGSLPASLLESHLFGHERGAFTGAERRHAGAFERAHGGTLFLDEVGELPAHAQPALLGVLQRGRFRRVGGESEVDVDVRVVSATNRDLRSEVNRGAFRADLYYRLAGTRIVVPALRERPEDIAVLVSHFVREAGAPGLPFDDAAMAELTRHYWRGNVRELKNTVESALAMGRLSLEGDPAPRPSTEPTSIETGSASRPWSGPPSGDAGVLVEYKEARAKALNDFERDYLARLLAATGGNHSEAARRARMDRPYLLSLLRKHSFR